MIIQIFCFHYFYLLFVPRAFGDDSSLVYQSEAICDLVAATDLNRIFPSWYCVSNVANGNLCYWAGISCDNRNYVTQIHLSSSGIYGTLPSSLIYLKSLSSLILNDNSFYGILPISLGHLSNLTVLNIDHNKFTGTFPSNQIFFNRLAEVTVSNNLFSGMIPSYLCTLTRLSKVDFNNNNLGCYPSCLSTVTYFDAGSTRECTSTPSHYPTRHPTQDPSHSPSNHPTSTPVHHPTTRPTVYPSRRPSFQPTSWPLFPTSNEMTEDDNNQITNKILCLIFNPINIYSIDPNFNCTKNTLICQQSKSIISGIDCHNSNIIHIIWPYYNISGSLPEALMNITSLEYLDLSHNTITSTIPNTISKLSNLKSLNLAKNCLTGSLPNSIGTLTSLSGYFNVEGNSLTGTIPPSISNLSLLLNLVLDSNQFSGTLSSRIISMTAGSLQWFSVGNNQLKGSLPNTIHVKNLTFFSVGYNNFDGKLPNFILSSSSSAAAAVTTTRTTTESTLSSENDIKTTYPLLELLNFEYNHFTGSIPTSFSTLRKLKILSLQSNELTGIVPAALCSLTALTEITLISNNLLCFKDCLLSHLSTATTIYLPMCSPMYPTGTPSLPTYQLSDIPTNYPPTTLITTSTNTSQYYSDVLSEPLLTNTTSPTPDPTSTNTPTTSTPTLSPTPTPTITTPSRAVVINPPTPIISKLNPVGCEVLVSLHDKFSDAWDIAKLTVIQSYTSTDASMAASKSRISYTLQNGVNSAFITINLNPHIYALFVITTMTTSTTATATATTDRINDQTTSINIKNFWEIVWTVSANNKKYRGGLDTEIELKCGWDFSSSSYKLQVVTAKNLLLPEICNQCLHSSAAPLSYHLTSPTTTTATNDNMTMTTTTLQSSSQSWLPSRLLYESSPYLSILIHNSNIPTSRSYNAINSLYYSISDPTYYHLISIGTLCSGVMTEMCDEVLDDGYYILRIGIIAENNFNQSSIYWEFCGSTGGIFEEITFSWFLGICTVLKVYQHELVSKVDLEYDMYNSSNIEEIVEVVDSNSSSNRVFFGVFEDIMLSVLFFVFLLGFLIITITSCIHVFMLVIAIIRSRQGGEFQMKELVEFNAIKTNSDWGSQHLDSSHGSSTDAFVMTM